MFSVGDVHARQGDGEIVGAPEIGALITLRLSYFPEKSIDSPVVEDAQNWHVIGWGDHETEAIRRAVFAAAEFVQRTYGLALDDAMILLTMIAKIHCCRTGPWGDQGSVIAVSMPKSLLPAKVSEPSC